MGCLGDLTEKITLGVVSLAKMLLSMGVIIVVHEKLTNVPTACLAVGSTTIYNTSDISCIEKCALGTKDGVNICSYAYAVAATSIIASIALFALLCFTMNCCGLGSVLEIAFAALGSAWWTAAGAVFSASIKNGWSNGVVEERWKNFIQGLAWTEAGLFLLVFLWYLFKIASAAGSCLYALTCCGCCGCFRGQKASGKVSPEVYV